MMPQDLQDSHNLWLEDIEYRREFGSESAKLEIATTLAAARETAGITQAALAELAGVSQAYIAKLERGDANPTIGNIGRLLACMWLKAFIGFRDMRPNHSFVCDSIERQDAMELFDSFGSDSVVTQNTSYSDVTYHDGAAWSEGTNPAIAVNGR